MKKLLTWLVPVVLITACDDKDPNIHPPAPTPPMKYTALNNTAIRFGQQKMLDLDGDQVNDLLFSTMLVGDPVLRRDRKQYFVTAAFHVYFQVNSQEQTPALENRNMITIASPQGYEWYNANSVTLAEKIIEETGTEHWEGNWKSASHKFIPVQILKNNLRYNGWVEATFNTGSEELILHRGAISLEAEKDIKAGE